MDQSSRNYALSDADLMMFASNLAQTITRDAAEFADYGVDAATIAAFVALGNEFEVFPSDVVLVAYIKGKTEEKNSLMEQVKRPAFAEQRIFPNRRRTQWVSTEYQKGRENPAPTNSKIVISETGPRPVSTWSHETDMRLKYSNS